MLSGMQPVEFAATVDTQQHRLAVDDEGNVAISHRTEMSGHGSECSLSTRIKAYGKTWQFRDFRGTTAYAAR